MAERSVLVRLQANVADFKAQMQQAERSVKRLEDEFKNADDVAKTTAGRMVQSADKHREAWDTAGTSMATFGAAAVAGLGFATKAAIDWESAWAGVTKTVSGSDAELAQVEDGLRNLARTLPATHGEIAAVAEAAGQLGVQTGSIVDFTKTMIDLGETTNLSADEAATSIAQLMNVMQTAPQDVGRLGAALVALGNDGASTEADILNMASYLSGAAALIGSSESDVLALANALTSLGINAERGGGVMTRVMQDVYSAVQMGGDGLQGFADVAGMSSADFARAFEEDPIRAIGAFTDGLGRAKDSGENVVELLGNLGYVGTQDTAVLLQLASAQGDVTDNLDLGNEAWQENTALVDEAAKRYDTTAAKLQITKNNLHDAAIEIGGTFLPILTDMAEGLAGVAGWFSDLPDPIKGTVSGLGAVAGVGTLAGGAFLLLFPRVMETRQAFQTLRADMPGVTDRLGKVGRAAGIAGAAFVALQTISAAFSPSSDELDRFSSRAQALGGPDVSGQIRSLSDEIERQQAIVDDAAIAWEFWGGGIFSNDEAADANDRIESLRDRLESLQHQKELDEIASRQAAEAADAMAQSTGNAGGAVGQMVPQLESTFGSLQGYATALGLDEEATEDLRTKTEELGTSLADFITPLGTYTGLLDEKKAAEEAAAIKAAEEAGKGADAWRDFVVDTGFSFDEYMQRLRDQVAAQENWQTNMLLLAGRVSQGTLEELARMGPEGAPLVADLVNRSDAELDEMDGMFAARSKEATDAWGVQLMLAQPVLAAIGRTAGAGVVAELAAQLMAGTTTVADIARQYGVNLAGGINPVLAALGADQIRTNARIASGSSLNALGLADGGLVDYYAGGGLRENHVAQIAPAGAWRVWAEEETGGEAYIPLAPSKRARSIDIWRETGRRLGQEIDDIEAYANGGFHSVGAVPRPPSTAPFRAPISTSADAVMQKAYAEATAWLTANLEPLASPSSSSGLGPRAATARQHVIDTWGITNIGGFARRNIYGTNTPSKHSMGKAIDVMTSNLRLGWDIANFFHGAGRGAFGVDNVIWQQSIASRPGGGFSRMADRGSPTQNHYDHVHVDFLKMGAVLDFLAKKGGPFNPHVRDSGGPLLPGYTLNATGGLEDVVPRHVTDAGRSSSPAPPAPVTVHARVFVGNREITDIARVEAETVVIEAENLRDQLGAYSR